MPGKYSSEAAMQSFVRSPKTHGWVLLYEAAAYEVDDHNRLELIALAVAAISWRKEALARSKADRIQEEAALDDASYILAAFRKAAEFSCRQNQLETAAPQALSRTERA
jgi:hypothetical protein